MKLLLLLLIVTSINSFHAKSQEIVTTAGDFFYTPAYSMSWTMGEPVTESIENQSVIFFEGFQQSAQNYVGISEMIHSFDFTIYPNPFSNAIQLISNLNDNQVNLVLYDAKMQKVLEENKPILQHTPLTLETETIANGIYFLHIQTGNKSTNSLIKLIKNK